MSKLDTKGTAQLYLHRHYWLVRYDRPGHARDHFTIETQLRENRTKSDLVRCLVGNDVPVDMRGAIYLAAMPETFALCRERWAESSIWDLIDDIEKRVDLLTPTSCNRLRLTWAAKDGRGDLDWFAEYAGRRLRLSQLMVGATLQPE